MHALRGGANSGKRGVIQITVITPTVERLAIRLVESGTRADALDEIGIGNGKTAETDQIGELALNRMFGRLRTVASGRYQRPRVERSSELRCTDRALVGTTGADWRFNDVQVTERRELFERGDGT